MKMHIFKQGVFVMVLWAPSIGANAMELPQNISSYLESKKLTEDETLPFLETEGKTFVEYVIANRVQILNNFSTVAANVNQQKLLLAAMEFTTAADYLATLDKVCDLKQSNVRYLNLLLDPHQ